jgi:hypothetical protein
MVAYHIILVLRRLRQEDGVFEASLGYVIWRDLVLKK